MMEGIYCSIDFRRKKLDKTYITINRGMSKLWFVHITKYYTEFLKRDSSVGTDMENFLRCIILVAVLL